MLASSECQKQDISEGIANNLIFAGGLLMAAPEWYQLDRDCILPRNVTPWLNKAVGAGMPIVP